MQNNRFSRVDFMNLDFDMCIVLTFLPCSIFVSMRVQWTLDTHLSCISCSDNSYPDYNVYRRLRFIKIMKSQQHIANKPNGRHSEQKNKH